MLLTKTYPYQNKSLADLPGEEWRDIPGFEGSYQASNLGRLKSLDRTIPHPRLYTQFVKGQILSHSVSKNKNIKTGEPMIDLRISLNIEGKQYYFNTRRVIYQTFIDKNLNYDKDGKYVINIDGDGYNNCPNNLKLVTKSQKQKRAFQRDRVTSSLGTADRSQWPKTYGGYSLRKPIAKYDLEGKLINQFESICEASRQTGMGEKEIIQVAKGVRPHFKGFKWEYL